MSVFLILYITGIFIGFIGVCLFYSMDSLGNEPIEEEPTIDKAIAISLFWLIFVIKWIWEGLYWFIKKIPSMLKFVYHSIFK